MEKLVYLAWKEPAASGNALRDALRERAAPVLAAAGAERLRIAVADDAVAVGSGLCLGQDDPAKSALVSFWLEQSQDRGAAEACLREHAARIAGYLVVESRPIVNTTHTTPPGERTPGFSLVTGIHRRPDISKDEFLRLWYDEQRACAIETQSTFGYVRNEVVRTLTPEAPCFDAIVEESFPTGALDEPAVFYDAVGDPERLAGHQKRMAETCAKFIDFSRIESHPMSEYDFA